MKLKAINIIVCVFVVLFGLSAMGVRHIAHAETAEELRSKINEKSLQINQIEQEIAQYEKQLQTVGGERKTLEGAIAQLNLSRKKLLSDIDLTQKKIEQTTYTIERIGIAIEDKEQKIARDTEILADAIRIIDESDRQTMVETFLGSESMSQIWVELDQLAQVQSTVQVELHKLQDLKADLESQQDSQRKEHESLNSFKSKLSGQKQVVDQNKKEKDTLLSSTKSKEAEYQRLLAEKQNARKQIESELQDYESKLQYVLDPSKLPQTGSQALGWPVEHPVITQGFGITSFARGGAYGYDAQGNPNPHRGVDFQASVGTPILATASGVVRDAVNMDAFPGCYSYGRWILIDHDNGLSTLYAHLSVMSVSAGTAVKAGQIIGYSGQSGYATGPHLHFSVFDKSAVKVSPFSWSIGCKQAKVPYAAFEAYLNPLNYLPK